MISVLCILFHTFDKQVFVICKLDFASLWCNCSLPCWLECLMLTAFWTWMLSRDRTRQRDLGWFQRKAPVSMVHSVCTDTHYCVWTNCHTHCYIYTQTHTHTHIFVLLLHFALVCYIICYIVCSFMHWCVSKCACLWMPGCRYVFMGVCCCHDSSISHSILTVDVWWWSVYHSLTAMRFLDSLRLSLSFSLLHLVYFARFNPLPPHTYVLPTVNLLLSWFSDKKLERGKWNFALLYFPSLFLSFLSSLSLLALNDLTSLSLCCEFNMHFISHSRTQLNETSNSLKPTQSYICCCSCTCTVLVCVSLRFSSWSDFKVWFPSLSVLPQIYCNSDTLVTDRWEGNAVT